MAATAAAVVPEEDTELRDLLVQTLENSGVLNRIKVGRAGLGSGDSPAAPAGRRACAGGRHKGSRGAASGPRAGGGSLRGRTGSRGAGRAEAEGALPGCGTGGRLSPQLLGGGWHEVADAKAGLSPPDGRWDRAGGGAGGFLREDTSRCIFTSLHLPAGRCCLR